MSLVKKLFFGFEQGWEPDNLFAAPAPGIFFKQLRLLRGQKHAATAPVLTIG